MIFLMCFVVVRGEERRERMGEDDHCQAQTFRDSDVGFKMKFTLRSQDRRFPSKLHTLHCLENS